MKQAIAGRRRFVRSAAGAGAGVALVSFASLFDVQTASAAHDRMDSVETIVNLAATAETLAATSYYGTLTSGSFNLNTAQRQYLLYALSSELYHLEFLQSAGGRALTDRFYVPAQFLTDFNVNTQTFIAAETAFTGAYLAATRRFAELGNPRLAATTAQHAATEAEHLALTRQIAGLLPNPNGLPAPIYYNVSDAVPTLTPFLNGGTGFIGPVMFPGVEAIRRLLGSVQALKVPVFLNVF